MGTCMTPLFGVFTTRNFFQAGLSWITILNKEKNRAAFDQSDYKNSYLQR
jgi:3-methyladenine DNA glycosylase Tag